ncbi:MAG TPA: hypothetical protein VJS39_10385 [Gemmatimonadaceae bacterium]|nr:hypothetical protein [Gemmatimonadaceae bacterium]
MLEAIPTNVFAKNFRLEQDNKLVGELDPSIWRCKATLELEEGTYNLYREKFLGGDYLLEHDGTIVARAIKTHVFRDKYAIQVGNRVLEFKKLRWTSRKFGLFDGDQLVGGIYPRGIFTKRANIDLPQEWPLANRVFMFWLAFVIWKRESQAAS